MFAAEFEPAISYGCRRAPRAPVSLDAAIGRGGLDRTLCRVSDLSVRGARLHTYSPLRRGAKIWLTLPVAGQIVATVVWATEFIAGCEFARMLDEATFAMMVEHDAQACAAIKAGSVTLAGHALW